MLSSNRLSYRTLLRLVSSSSPSKARGRKRIQPPRRDHEIEDFLKTADARILVPADYRPYLGGYLLLPGGDPLLREVHSRHMGLVFTVERIRFLRETEEKIIRGVP